MTAIRLVVAASLVAVAISMAGMVNAIWQNVYCGTPLCRTAPFSPIPCEPVDKVLAEWAELERVAKDRPARW